MLNFILLFDYNPKPKEVKNLTFDQTGSYTLAVPDTGNTSIVIYYNKQEKAKQYIKLDQKYEDIIMTNSGLDLISKDATLCFKNEDDKLVENKCENLDTNISTSELSIGVGKYLEIEKAIDVKNLFSNKLIEKENNEDINILKIYPIDYENAFNVDGVNYIPRDFDQESLHN